MFLMGMLSLENTYALAENIDSPVARERCNTFSKTSSIVKIPAQ